MRTKYTVLLPRAEQFKLAARPPFGSGITDLRGARVVFVDHARPNADVILEAFQRQMEAKFEIAATVIRKMDLGLKSLPLPEEMFEKLVKEVDAAVVAVGSCGATTARSVRDAADFVEHGISGVAIIAPSLAQQARAYAKVLGLASERIVILPLGSHSPDAADSIPAIRQACEDCFEQVVAGIKAPLPAGRK